MNVIKCYCKSTIVSMVIKVGVIVDISHPEPGMNLGMRLQQNIMYQCNLTFINY